MDNSLWTKKNIAAAVRKGLRAKNRKNITVESVRMISNKLELAEVKVSYVRWFCVFAKKVYRTFFVYNDGVRLHIRSVKNVIGD